MASTTNQGSNGGTSRRTALGALVSTAVYVAFLLTFLEVALQTYYRVTAGDFLFRRTTLPVWAPDEYSGIFNRPNLAVRQHTSEFEASYYTDSRGLRVPAEGASYALDAGSDTWRAMLLGPSFAFGWGVDYEDTFAARLEELLEAERFAGGRNVEVINAGVNSMPPPPQLNWYRHVGGSYRPDLVIQFIYGSMLVKNEARPKATVDAQGRLVMSNRGSAWRLIQHAKNLATVFYAWVLYTRLDSLLADPSNHDQPGEVLGAGRELRMDAEFDPEAPEVAEAIAFYRELAETVRASGSELLVVYFPLSYAIHREDESRWRHLGVRDVERQIAFDDAFARHLQEIGIPCLDATRELQSAAVGGRRLYYWLDIHWTPEGNAAVARAVARRLLGEERLEPR